MIDKLFVSSMVVVTMFLGIMLTSTRISADDIADITDTASVTVPTSCSMTATIDSEHSATIPNGIYSGVSGYYPNGIGKTTIATFCNDNSGYAIYAIGYTGDKYDGEDHTKLIGATNGQKITTGAATSGSTSNWAMKLTKVTDSSQSYNPENLTITNGYDDYNVIPDTYTKVANYTSTTDQTLGSVLSTTYAAYISPTEVADTYTGKVKYTLVHPSTADKPNPPVSYTISKLSRGLATDDNSRFSWTEIDAPTTDDPETDTSHSGIFEWNGTDSNGGDKPIYFYRGILDLNVGTYGSDGDAEVYPNYVKLDNDTCWRIVRTTSTGGVKMIYNGMWNGATCANSGLDVTIARTSYNTQSSTIAGKIYHGLSPLPIQSAGYTYSNAPTGNTETAVSEVFGAFGDDTTTNVNQSIIKQYMEDWYEENLIQYTNILEGDAGYCQDRTMNEGTNWSVPLSDSDLIVPYGDGLVYTFGSFMRNGRAALFDVKLTCPRGKVDLYSYEDDAGNGNGQLKYPIALLTADEASMAGNGINTAHNTYNNNSYLNSGSDFWLLSPAARTEDCAVEAMIKADGSQKNYVVSGASSYRPVITLKYGVYFTSGTGTADTPWIVKAP